jgi:hypothetical protein
MNAVKRTARKRHYRKLYGPGHERLADNRSFRPHMRVIPADERKQAIVQAWHRHEHATNKLDEALFNTFADQVKYIEEKRDAAPLWYTGFHVDLWKLTFGEVQRRYEMLKKLVEAK